MSRSTPRPVNCMLKQTSLLYPFTTFSSFIPPILHTNWFHEDGIRACIGNFLYKEVEDDTPKQKLGLCVLYAASLQKHFAENLAEMHPYLQKAYIRSKSAEGKYHFTSKLTDEDSGPFWPYQHTPPTLPQLVSHWDCAEWGKHYYFLFSYDLTLLSTVCTGGCFFLTKTAWGTLWDT